MIAPYPLLRKVLPPARGGRLFNTSGQILPEICKFFRKSDRLLRIIFRDPRNRSREHRMG